MANTKQLLTRAELAAKLRVSYRTIQNWDEHGRIPSVGHPLGRDHGRTVYYDWEKVRRALKIPK